MLIKIDNKIINTDHIIEASYGTITGEFDGQQTSRPLLDLEKHPGGGARVERYTGLYAQRIWQALVAHAYIG